MDDTESLREGFSRDAQNRERARLAMVDNSVTIDAGPGALIEGSRDKFIVSRMPDEG